MTDDCRPTIGAETYPERVFFYWLEQWASEWEFQQLPFYGKLIDGTVETSPFSMTDAELEDALRQ